MKCPNWTPTLPWNPRSAADQDVLLELEYHSVRNKTDIIRDTVINQNIDILSLAAIRITDNDKYDFHVKELTFPGYEFSHILRKGNCGWGEIGVLHNVSVKATCSGNYKSESFENVLIHFNTGSSCHDLVTLYMPKPHHKYKFTTTHFYEDLHISSRQGDKFWGFTTRRGS